MPKKFISGPLPIECSRLYHAVAILTTGTLFFIFYFFLIAFGNIIYYFRFVIL